MSKNQPIVRRKLLQAGGAAALGHSLSSMGFAAQSGAAPNTAGVKVEKDVVVGKGGGTDLHCDIYRPPAGTEKRMALIHVHGGGFARGSKDMIAAKAGPTGACRNSDIHVKNAPR